MYVFELMEHLLLVKMNCNSNSRLFTPNLLLSSNALTTHHLSTLHGKGVLQMEQVWQFPLLSNEIDMLGDQSNDGFTGMWLLGLTLKPKYIIRKLKHLSPYMWWLRVWLIYMLYLNFPKREFNFPKRELGWRCRSVLFSMLINQTIHPIHVSTEVIGVIHITVPSAANTE